MKFAMLSQKKEVSIIQIDKIKQKRKRQPKKVNEIVSGTSLLGGEECMSCVMLKKNSENTRLSHKKI